MPVGAEPQPGGGVHFRVWAPLRRQVDVIVDGAPHALRPEPGGYYSAFVTEARAGSRYRFRLDGGDAFPDPASRYQPEGPHGPSEVVDAGVYPWSDQAWPGVRLAGAVLYELHIGTFTPEGTWRAAMERLEFLRDVGVNVVEMMPVADFDGQFGWGYDGVNLFAPTRLYGTPDDLRAFVGRAHELGVGVILDVVYNHLGPSGNYLSQYAGEYFSQQHKTDWGPAINYDGAGCGPVREYFLANARYWIEEFHFDGLRLDATQDIYDESEPHILRQIGDAVRAGAGQRTVLIVNENEPQQTDMVRPANEGGYGLDMLWNDDLHHTLMVRVTGRNEAYYTDYLGGAQEFVSALKYGYLYQGQSYKWQKKRRGTSSRGLAAHHFVAFSQNHDQIANSARGQRIHQLASPGAARAAAAIVCLGPATPMLFQGQEFNASARFHYFADHNDDLNGLIKQGRREFMAQFRSLALAEMDGCFEEAAPHLRETFTRCQLRWEEKEQHEETVRLYRDLLRLRREDRTIAAQGRHGCDGSVVNNDCFTFRWFGETEEQDRLMVVNFGIDLCLNPVPDPLLAPPAGCHWELLWSSEDCRYGGLGKPPVETARGFHVPGQAAVVLRPAPGRELASHLTDPKMQESQA